MRVLVIDDEAVFANTLAQRLKIRGLNADTAYDGRAGLDKLRTGGADVVVLDLKMPGMNGIEVLEEIKKDYPNIPVIMLTGHGTANDEEEVYRLGGVGFLRKPADIEHLEQKIRMAVKHASGS